MPSLFYQREFYHFCWCMRLVDKQRELGHYSYVAVIFCCQERWVEVICESETLNYSTRRADSRFSKLGNVEQRPLSCSLVCKCEHVRRNPCKLWIVCKLTESLYFWISYEFIFNFSFVTTVVMIAASSRLDILLNCNGRVLLVCFLDSIEIQQLPMYVFVDFWGKLVSWVSTKIRDLHEFCLTTWC